MRLGQVLSSLDLGSLSELLMSLYHGKGSGRKPYSPVSMLKAQVLKYLRRIPSDRRLALLLRWDKEAAKTCGFKHETPSHGLFTQFRRRLGKEGYEKVFSVILKQLLKLGVVNGNS